jgi:hypothetical protein
MNYKIYYKKKGIYKITINKKIYIGSSINIYDRYSLHKSTLLKNTHRNRYLQRAFNKYKNFDFEIIETFDEISREKLLEKELYYINLLNPEYNLIKNPVLNTFSEETKLKISNSVKKAYSEGRLINPWSLNGNYIDVYNLDGVILYSNVLVKDAIKIINVANRSVINNAIRLKKYKVKNFIVVPHKFELTNII